MKHLYRGMWAEQLSHGDDLLVGGSIFSEELTTSIELDYDSFRKLPDDKWNPDLIIEIMAGIEPGFSNWAKSINPEIDPYVAFITKHTGDKVEEQLQVDPNHLMMLDRNRIINSGNAKLSDLVGNSACAERAALGQNYLQAGLRDGYSSIYMSGIEAKFKDPTRVGDHSFIVIKKDTKEEKKTYIFDIARPIRQEHTIPSLYQVSNDFTFETLNQSKNLLFPAKELFLKYSHHFGVGNPMLMYEPKIIQ